MDRPRITSAIVSVSLALFVASSAAGLACNAQTASDIPPAKPAKPAKPVRQAPVKRAPAPARQPANPATQTGTANASRPNQRQPQNTQANPASQTQPAASAKSANLANPAAPSKGSTVAAPSTTPVGTGTLSWATRVYTSTGCTHNGNQAVCTFTFVNQGNQANLVAGGELSGVELVDDAHVPHRWDGVYFMDKYGAQQRRLIVQPGDTGTYVVTFPNVAPQVSSAEFHLRNQVIGGITVTSAATSTTPAPAATAIK